MPILENAKFEYTSETKIPYDSIFISGQIKNKQGENPPFATIGLDDKHGITSDKYGHYKAAFLRNRRNSIRLSFTSIGYNGQSFILNPTSNFHKLNVKLPLVDTLSCSKVFNSIENTPSLTYKNEIIFYLNTPSVKMKHSMAISFIEKDNKSTLINQLLKAKERQPALSMNIDELITLINK